MERYETFSVIDHKAGHHSIGSWPIAIGQVHCAVAQTITNGARLLGPVSLPAGF